MPYSADNQRYSLMKYAKCGKSGLKLPLISLGVGVPLLTVGPDWVVVLTTFDVVSVVRK